MRSTTMPPATAHPRVPAAAKRSARALLLLAAVPLVALACSKSDTAAPPPGSVATTATTISPLGPGAGGVANAPCAVETLTPLAQAKYPGASLSELACNGTQAAATVVGAPGGDAVAVFAVKNGAWVLAGSGGAEDPVAGVIGTDVSLTTYNNWRTKYDTIHHPERLTTVPRPASQVTEADPKHQCDNQQDGNCKVTTTTFEIITTTTLKVTTTPPSTEAPTTQPTTPPVTQPSTSPFCQSHPLDARCLSNPGFPG